MNLELRPLASSGEIGLGQGRGKKLGCVLLKGRMSLFFGYVLGNVFFLNLAKEATFQKVINLEDCKTRKRGNR